MYCVKVNSGMHNTHALIITLYLILSVVCVQLHLLIKRCARTACPRLILRCHCNRICFALVKH